MASLKPRKIWALILLAGLWNFAGAPTGTPDAPIPFQTEIWQDERTGAQAPALSQQVVVRFKPEVPERRVAEIARAYGMTVLQQIPELNAYLFRLPPSLSLREAVVSLGSKPEALYAEPNLLGKLHRVPNDPLYTASQNYQWSLKPPAAPFYGRINAEQAWDLETGSENVTVAVIDSGVDLTHPDLSPRWASWGSDTVDFIGQTNTHPPCQPDNDPFDSSNVGHGTAVSGLVSAATDNNQGIAGTAWRVKILPLRVIGNCTGSGTSAIFYTSRAIVYSAERADVKVLSLSLGFYVASELMEDAVEYAYSRGKLVVASAGNDGDTAPQYPAAFPQVMGITSVDENGQKSDFSTYGDWTDLAAPGGANYNVSLGITTTDMQGNLGYVNGDYNAGFGGTSASAPYVAGVAALVFSHHPDWTPDQVEQHLKSTASVPPGWNPLWGAGIVNAYDAVRLPETTPPSLVSAEPISADRILLTFSEEMDPLTASQEANYTITGGAGLSVLAALPAPDNRTIQLMTTPQSGGASYVVTVSQSVTDVHGNPLPSSLASRQKTFIGINLDKNLALQSNGGVATAWWTSSQPDFCVADATSANANDGNLATPWTQNIGSNPNFPTFLMVRLSAPYRLDRLVLRTDPGYVMEFQIEAGWALCGITQNIVVQRNTFTGSQTFTLNPPVDAREVMVTFFSAQGSVTGTAKVTELEVYGEKLSESNPPQVALTEPADGALVSGTITLRATATDDTTLDRVAFYEASNQLCTDSTAPYSCDWDTSGAGDGTRTLTARAFDIFQNSATSAPVTATVDNTPPETTITASPPSPSASSTADFEFSSTEPGSTFACALDAAPFEPCSSPVSYTDLADGSHRFSVTATDPAGNVDPTPAHYDWIVDTVPPETTIVAGPTEGSLTRLTSATFQFASSETGSTFECELDGTGWNPCDTPITYENLSDGAHTFRVRATDPTGKTDPEPASRNWTVDATPPVLTITAGPEEESFISSTSVVFEFTSSESNTETECFFDEGTWSPCTSPRPYSSLADGPHRFAVRGTDPAGNLSNTAIRTFTVDPVPPVLTLSSLPGNGSITNSTDLQLQFLANEPATFECQLDTEPPETCVSPYTRGGLSDGPHIVTLTATDRAGNVVSEEVRWTVDTRPPDTTITSGPPPLTNLTTARFLFSASGTTFECKLDDTPWEVCVSPKEYTFLADGAHHFEVSGTDAAGNRDPTPATYDWVVDTVPPGTTLAEKPPAATASRQARFTFTSDDPEAEFYCRVDENEETVCNSPYDAVFSGGSHTFSVRARDKAGNFDPTPASYQWEILTGSLLVERGPHSPADTRVNQSSVPVPVLQLHLTADPLEGAHLTRLIVKSDGDGNDARDIEAVALILDTDDDGLADPAEPILASSTFSEDNGNAVLAFDHTIPSGTSAALLVTISFRAPGPATMSAVPTNKPPASLFLALAMMALAGWALREFSHRGRAQQVFVLMVLGTGALIVSACGGGGGGTPPAAPKSYTVLVASAESVTATGTDSGSPLPITGSFPIPGATLTW